ncbi:hypothetical protein HYH02_002293 [Chlamydomonas schloesseri]|uniref:Photolyase/cryptochrome alpha/beta domain-containing protein n=1 Tax=Chlamydomonas schloesseri TaxID=2026947 RepID=A0A835WUH5_9CHLO|nr:hypothetical protein HYH02_002293 [Chlamydomonas schloesseri]|eukprot:KAG2452956.1 hypothetical protein HYH02_002293 [Chlamydomonas schloesseri]
MASESRGRRGDSLPKTHAKSVFCLTDKDLEAVAHRKWGGAEGLAAEQRRREARREVRAAAAAASPGALAGVAADASAAGDPACGATTAAAAGAGAQAVAGGLDRASRAGSLGWLQLPPLITERIRQVLPLQLLGGSDGATVTTIAATDARDAVVPRPAAGSPVQRGSSSKRQRLEAPAAAAAAAAAAAMAAGEPAGSAPPRAGLAAEAEVVDLVMDETGEAEEEVGEVAGGPGDHDAVGHRPIPAQGRKGMEVEAAAPLSAAAAAVSKPAGGTTVDTDDEDVIVISSSSSEASEASPSQSDAEQDVEGGSGGRGAGETQQAASAAGVAAADLAAAQPLATGAGSATAVEAARGEYVMYWMKTAVRGHENPALDTALAAASALQLPLLAAAFVLPGPTCQAHGNLRRIKFQLEGLRDAQRELQQRLGLRLHVHAEGLTAAAVGEASGGGGGASSAGASNGGATRVPSGADGSVASSPSGPGWEDLVATASKAALVVTEDMPVDPDAGWLTALVRRLQRGNGDGGGAHAAAVGGTVLLPPPGVWAVDTACVVPMRLVTRAYEKAYAYRSATEGWRRCRMKAVYAGGPFCWPGAVALTVTASGGTAAAPAAATAASPGTGPMHRFLQRAGSGPGGTGSTAQQVADAAPASDGAGASSPAAARAPIAPVTPEWLSLDLLALPPAAGSTVPDLGAVAAAIPGVDTSVPGVVHMIGGSSAGYARWDAWRRSGGVGRYAASRNDAMQRGGTSRLSPYLHWGMVSPFRVTREAAASGGSGCAKFLDELLVWRELAYSFCLHRCGKLDSLRVLPRWAQDTLAAHAADPRALRSLQQMETGTTGDAFWDAAQRQLAAHGELHNNVRMTWGKAPLGWCASPQEALSTVLHLNHRYALDGCDPASYGGVLWCFGLFDGPKDPASTPITGTLRRRPTSSHARRLDPAAYEALRP